MEPTREINALFKLIDDPDEDVFSVVSSKIVDFGKGIIPNLEHLWENTISEEVQTRIELLIHRLHLSDLHQDTIRWRDSSYHDLLEGSLLVSRFQYPDLGVTGVMQEIEKIRRNVWLELNAYLTGLEQVNVMTSILYNYYNFKGSEVSYSNPEEFLVHKVLDTKRGNAIANGILYLVLCGMLDIPIKAINIPRQFVLAYFDENDNLFDPPRENDLNQIQFFVDALSGQVFSHKDIDNYFKRISVPPVAAYFKPQSNKDIIRLLLEEFSKCFDNEKDAYKQAELLALSKLIGNNE
jgi:regulator of sirC expression with transglutaminase-like and TPR domain